MDEELKALLAEAQDIIDHTPQPGRNDSCPCGSGKKYKACHLRLDEEGIPGDELEGSLDPEQDKGE